MISLNMIMQRFTEWSRQRHLDRKYSTLYEKIETLKDCAPLHSFTVDYDNEQVVFHDLGSTMSFSRMAEMQIMEFSEFGVDLWKAAHDVDPEQLVTDQQRELYKVCYLFWQEQK